MRGGSKSCTRTPLLGDAFLISAMMAGVPAAREARKSRRAGRQSSAARAHAASGGTERARSSRFLATIRARMSGTVSIKRVDPMVSEEVEFNAETLRSQRKRREDGGGVGFTDWRGHCAGGRTSELRSDGQATRRVPRPVLLGVTQRAGVGGVSGVGRSCCGGGGCGGGAGFCDAKRSITRTPPGRRRKWTSMPASASGRMDLLSRLERAWGVGQSGRRGSRSVAVPVQRGVRSRKAYTASTKGLGGGGVSKASRICDGVQFRAGAAAWAQARAAAWRVPEEAGGGGDARAWLTAVQRAPRIWGKTAWITPAISCSERRAASSRGGRVTVRARAARSGGAVHASVTVRRMGRLR